MTKQLSEWLRHFYFHGNCLLREFMVAYKTDQTYNVLFKKYGLLDKKIRSLPLLRENDSATVTFVMTK